ncbi:unnamed protein product [Rotaria magnacalcarata]|uniref:Uncharacterized protein n=1 Tax=Rotaria magnacalcarata TaxID=392030 RepID=A0A816R2C6_9BILA|nr:unnamed protein product [Rotaria magnacalcarata]CAF2090714.1 unnamed protein product [Rotaria magnacalcarata]CAF4151163.1 unnamed protein product [Rotaria magnacalcarata]CAF4180008.1 unnamed protein product [Rotaria magnacalcarata]
MIVAVAAAEFTAVVSDTFMITAGEIGIEVGMMLAIDAFVEIPIPIVDDCDIVDVVSSSIEVIINVSVIVAVTVLAAEFAPTVLDEVAVVTGTTVKAMLVLNSSVKGSLADAVASETVKSGMYVVNNEMMFELLSLVLELRIGVVAVVSSEVLGIIPTTII